MWHINKNNLPSCGTGIHRQLSNALKAYKNGQAVNNNIEVDVVGLTFFDDWAKVGELSIGDGEPQEIFCPLIHIDGEEGNHRLLTPDEIVGFVPELGIEYRLLVRRFRHKSSPSDFLFELIEIQQETAKCPR